jgi:hypothetical protein
MPKVRALELADLETVNGGALPNEATIRAGATPREALNHQNATLNGTNLLARRPLDPFGNPTSSARRRSCGTRC